MTAGMICLLAISIMALASMLMRLGVGLILDLRTGLQLSLGEYAELLEHGQLALSVGQCRDRIYHGLDVRQSAALCLFHPLIGVTVSVEDDSLMLSQHTS